MEGSKRSLAPVGREVKSFLAQRVPHLRMLGYWMKGYMFRSQIALKRHGFSRALSRLGRFERRDFTDGCHVSPQTL
jgi:hypothetical protein